MQRREKIVFFLAVAVATVLVAGESRAVTTVGNNVSVGGTLTVTGVSTFTGLSTFTAGFISSASSSFAGRVEVIGSLSTSSTLDVTGVSKFTGLTTHTGGFISSASSSMNAGGINISYGGNSSTLNSNHLAVSAGSFSSTTVSSTGITIIGDAINIQNTSTTVLTNGYLIIGAGTSTQRAVFDGTSGGGGIFSVQRTGNLSTSGTVYVYGLSTFNAGFLSNASSSINAGLQITGNLSSSGTLFVNQVTPSSSNAINLGAYTNTFKNVYVSSTVFAASSSVVHPTVTGTIYGDALLSGFGGRLVLRSPSNTRCWAFYPAAIQAPSSGIEYMGLTSTLLASCPTE